MNIHLMQSNTQLIRVESEFVWNYENTKKKPEEKNRMRVDVDTLKVQFNIHQSINQCATFPSPPTQS